MGPPHAPPGPRRCRPPPPLTAAPRCSPRPRLLACATGWRCWRSSAAASSRGASSRGAWCCVPLTRLHTVCLARPVDTSRTNLGSVVGGGFPNPVCELPLGLTNSIKPSPGAKRAADVWSGAGPPGDGGGHTGSRPGGPGDATSGDRWCERAGWRQGCVCAHRTRAATGGARSCVRQGARAAAAGAHLYPLTD